MKCTPKVEQETETAHQWEMPCHHPPKPPFGLMKANPSTTTYSARLPAN
jgi:hypothetical protein